MDSYLDKIQELESNNKNITTLNRLVEQYRDKTVELEREKFEAISTIELNSHELIRLRSELDSNHDAKRFLEDEIETLRAEIQTMNEASGNNHQNGGINFHHNNHHHHYDCTLYVPLYYQIFYSNSVCLQVLVAIMMAMVLTLLR